MDYRQILQSRANRKTRAGRPFSNFFETYQQCESAGGAILKNEIDVAYLPLIERSIVITTVTAIEVYYRDILDGIFRYCSPDYFEPKLKQIHPEKYDISELLEMDRHQIHPLELIASSISFQNIDKIDRIFSKFTDKPFWETIKKFQIRRKDHPENIVSWTHDDLLGLKATFDLRHELVHDPARRQFFRQNTLEHLGKAAHMVFGSDAYLMQVMASNRDPSLAPMDDGE